MENSEILKKEWSQAKEAQKKALLLFSEREKLEDMMHKGEITAKMHLKAVDHELDQLGDDFENEVKIRKERLIAALKKLPETGEKIAELESTLNQKKERREFLQSIEKLMSPFQEKLKEGAACQTAYRKRTPFSFIFGRHPKVLLGHLIAQATQEAKEAKKNVAKLQVSHLSSFSAFLHHFIQESEKRWNRALYEGKIIDFYRESQELMRDLEEEKTKLDLEIISIEKIFEEFLKQTPRIC